MSGTRMNAPGYGLSDRARVREIAVAAVYIRGVRYLFMTREAASTLAKFGFRPQSSNVKSHVAPPLRDVREPAGAEQAPGLGGQHREGH